MKILFVSHDDGKYGAAKSLIKLITLLNRQYHIIPIVITRKYNEINEWCKENNYENYVLPYFNAVTVYNESKIKLNFYRFKQDVRRRIGNFISQKILLSKLDINEIDLIYTNVSTIDLGAIIAKKKNIPHIWHIREFGKEDINAYPANKNYYNLMNQSQKIIAISNIIRSNWIKKGINESKIITIYNGIDLQEFNYKKSNLNDKILKIIFCGSAAKHKGIEDMINAVNILFQKNIQNIIVDIYGDYSNDYGEFIKRYVKEQKLDKIIRFKGFNSNIKEVMNEYDIGLVCSTAEAFGRITVEYMLAGVTVIASNTGANSEIILDKQNGELYELHNYEDLSRKIEKIYYKRELLHIYSEKGLETAIHKFSANLNANLIYKEIKSLNRKIVGKEYE